MDANGRRIKWRRQIALIAVLATGLSVTLVSGASAGEGIHVSGTYTPTNLGTTTCQPVDSSAFLFNCSTTGFVSQYSGDLTGTSVTNFTQQLNCATGRAHGKGRETFTGSAGDLGSGTLTWRDVFHANIDCSTFKESGFSILGANVSGSGDLAGLHGTLRFTDTTYDGVLH